MALWVLIPVKPFREGKSRLAAVLNPEERERLNRWLLQHVLQTLRQVPGLLHILVISRDPAVLALAREEGAQTLQESSTTTLNATLRRAVTFLRARGMQRALILPADLPRLTPEDVEALLAALNHSSSESTPVLVIAPDRYHMGTNALALDPLDNHEFTFGPGSFYKHIAAARRAGRFVHVVKRPGLAYDLDQPEDLSLVAHVFPQWQARAVSGFAS